MIGHQILELVEPEVGDGRENLAFFGNRLGENHVEGRETIGGDHEHALVIDRVEITDLAGIDLLQAQGGGSGHRENSAVGRSSKRNRRNLSFAYWDRYRAAGCL
ncbi:hypothetical protein D3C77_640140 [compost metagenome]